MKLSRHLLFPALLIALVPSLNAQEPPGENRYDIIGKMFRPFWSVLLSDTKSQDKAMRMRIVMKDVTGRLPKDFQGAVLDASVEFPDKVRLSAPVLGERVTVCRKGDEVWAVPGAKIEFLLKQFKPILPQATDKSKTPLFLPFTPQQAVFLPALFTLEEGKTFEDLNGEPCRVISGGLMPELARAARSEDFRARIWVASGYRPRQIEVTRKDFTATVAIEQLEFSPSLPRETWDPPAGTTDIYRTGASVLEQVLFVVMNSLQGKEGDQPWLRAK